MDRTDRFVAFSNVDPRRGKEGLDLFEKAVREWGFCGMKLYPPCGYAPNDQALFPFYEICRQFHLPVLTHIGPTSSTLSFRNTQPWDVDDAAFQFPEVNFILGHAGVMHYEQAGLLAQYRPNVYLDLSGFQVAVNRHEFNAIMAWHISHGLTKKLLFGSDWPIYRFWGSQKYWVEALQQLHQQGTLSTEDRDAIMGENLLGILPAMERKLLTYGT
jgi:predicted TIM-barrel fold metal-dependent hydrolase